DVCVNPNEPEHALAEIERGRAAGAIGIKLAASRRATDPLLDPVCAAAARHRLPILHHIWQHRRRDWPGQEASDAAELCHLAARHPTVHFILAHIGGGGVLFDSVGVGVRYGIWLVALTAISGEGGTDTAD